MENFIFCAMTLHEKAEDYSDHCQTSKIKPLINLKKRLYLRFLTGF